MSLLRRKPHRHTAGQTSVQLKIPRIRIPGFRSIARQGKRVYRRFVISFRYKLLLLVLMPLLVFIPLILALTLHRSYTFAQKQLYQKVRTDTNIAASSFSRQQKKYLDALTQLAESHEFYTAMKNHNAKRIQNLLTVLKLTEELDFVHLVDLHGRLLYDDTVFSQKTRPNKLISNVIHDGQPQVGLELYSPAYLFRELDFQSGNNSDQSVPDVIDSLQSSDQKALVIFAAYPVKNNRGQTIALLEAGVLVNGNSSLISAISNLVYGHESLTTDNKSLISIIVGGRRIASTSQNNPSSDKHKQYTKIPQHILDSVLRTNHQWVGETHEPGGVYLSAFQALKGYQGKNLAILETGFLAAPLRNAYQKDLILTAILFIAATLGTAIIAFLAARRIFKPIERIAEVIYAQEQGQDLRIGHIRSQDEIGAVARRFDHMLDLLHERNAEIQRSADNLEKQVALRTQELLQKNTELISTIELLGRTQQQLVWSEKFAALGELTAGIAHEINNPTAVIMGNMDVIREELTDELEDYDTEVNLIYEQIARIRSIINNLLKYSRSSPMSQNLQTVDVNDLVSNSLLLIRHEAIRKQAQIETALETDCQVEIDPQELQQVLINLLLNALHAIATRGSIVICTSKPDKDTVCIQIRDNGSGIDPESIGRIFDPFYTTKSNDGTGLGLSISYGLVARYGGYLEADSIPGEGTVFNIILRKRAKLSPQRQILFNLHIPPKASRSP